MGTLDVVISSEDLQIKHVTASEAGSSLLALSPSSSHLRLQHLHAPPSRVEPGSALTSLAPPNNPFSHCRCLRCWSLPTDYHEPAWSLCPAHNKNHTRSFPPTVLRCKPPPRIPVSPKAGTVIHLQQGYSDGTAHQLWRHTIKSSFNLTHQKATAFLKAELNA